MIFIARCVEVIRVYQVTVSNSAACKRCGGYGSQHDGERYRVHLCEPCFFQTLAYLREQRRIHTMFDDEQPADEQVFGQVARDDYFGES